jgi:hypothetical protein
MDNQPKYELPVFYTLRDRQRMKTPWYETPLGMVLSIPGALLSLVILLPVLGVIGIFSSPKPDSSRFLYDLDESSIKPPDAADVERAVQSLHSNPVLRK